MATTVPPATASPTDAVRGRRLVGAAWFFLVGSAVHVIDHLRRGQTSVTESLYVAGNIALVVQVVVITLVLTRHRWAPFVATAGGFGLAIGFAAAHWLPTWSAMSDSFIDRPASAFSYVASSLEILGALAVGCCGFSVWRAEARTAG